MTEPVTDPLYWKTRLEAAPKSNPHHAVFLCSDVRWAKIEARHAFLLEQHLKPTDSVLDAGCGWGRLLDLMPSWWQGNYAGVDVCPEFVAKAKQRCNGQRAFYCESLDQTQFVGDAFDWAVLISIRGMLVRNCGKDGWRKAKKELLRVCRRLLCLEYDPTDKGKVLERRSNKRGERI